MLSLCPKIVIAVLLLTLNLALADDGAYLEFAIEMRDLTNRDHRDDQVRAGSR